MKKIFSQAVYQRVPVRTCIACRTARPKRELVRLVSRGEGSVEVDPRGKLPGRGVYLCPRTSCWQTGLKKGCLERALKASIAPESRNELVKYAESLTEEAGE